jgi:hypothetical protein
MPFNAAEAIAGTRLLCGCGTTTNAAFWLLAGDRRAPIKARDSRLLGTKSFTGRREREADTNLSLVAHYPRSDTHNTLGRRPYRNLRDLRLSGGIRRTVRQFPQTRHCEL